MGNSSREMAVTQDTQQSAGEEDVDNVWKACAFGEFDTLKRLVAREEVNVLDTPDEKGYHCLQWAALNNRVAIVTYLIDQGVNLNAQDGTGQTALHWAAVRGSVGVLEMLLRAGCDATVTDSRGYNVCHVAAQYGQTSVIYHLYMKWGLEMDLADADGRTALHWAAYKGFSDTAKLLIVMGCDVMAIDVEECTPLHWAAIKGNADVSMVLLQGGSVDALESTDASGCTPSQLAIDKGHRALGINLAEYRRAKEMLTRGGICGALAKLHLSPIIWAIILGMLSFMSFSVIANKASFPHSASVIAIGTWITYVFAFFGLIFLYKTTVADPGFLPKNTAAGAHSGTVFKSVPRGLSMSSNKEDIEEGDESSEENSLNSAALWAGNWNQLCVTCRIVRPLRAKHCAVTDRCVQCFDHYCPWVGNAIGKGNRHYFVIFLWLELVAILTSVIIVIMCLHTALATSNDSQSFSVIGPIFFVVFDIMLLISVSALAAAQTSQVARNVTTNELSNWHRYPYLRSSDGDFHNPFDRGCKNNCSEVFFPQKASKPCYTREQIKKPSTKIGERDSLVKSSID